MNNYRYHFTAWGGGGRVEQERASGSLGAFVRVAIRQAELWGGIIERVERLDTLTGERVELRGQFEKITGGRKAEK